MSTKKQENIKSNYFNITIILIILIIMLYFIADEFTKQISMAIAICIISAFLIFKFNIILQLKDYERAVIFRFGKVNRVGGPGWAIVIPFIEKPNLVTLRTQVFDIPPQQVITKDNIRLTIDAILYISVNTDKEDIINSVIKVENYKLASTMFITAMLRDILGGFNLTDVITSTENINHQITDALKVVAKEWGIKVQAVEITDIQIPENIIESMHEQKAAVQKKLAVYELAESEKAKILAVKSATEELSDKAVVYYYIKALEKMAEGQSSKIIFPMELTNLLGKITQNITTNPSKIKINKSEENKLEKYLPLLKTYLEKSEEMPNIKIQKKKVTKKNKIKNKNKNKIQKTEKKK
jgi:erythrocyte band 7 integral membrane protein